MTKLGRTITRLTIVLGVACAAAAAAAQDQEIYDAIDCSQWTLNSDGTWDTGPRAGILGSRRPLANLKHIDLAGFYVNGVDVSAWLTAKCAKKCRRVLGLLEVCD